MEYCTPLINPLVNHHHHPNQRVGVPDFQTHLSKCAILNDIYWWNPCELNSLRYQILYFSPYIDQCLTSVSLVIQWIFSIFGYFLGWNHVEPPFWWLNSWPENGGLPQGLRRPDRFDALGPMLPAGLRSSTGPTKRRGGCPKVGFWAHEKTIETIEKPYKNHRKP